MKRLTPKRKQWLLKLQEYKKTIIKTEDEQKAKK